MVDAGSSGSKVFSFSAETTSAKLLTQCSKSKREQGMTNMGIAALAYSKEDCEWQIGEKELTPLAHASPDYANVLLNLLAKTYVSSSGRHHLDDVQNKGAVPVLATAGMRLLSQPANDKVWGYLCGKTSSELTIAPAGPQCGTIPGTTEAFYEFVANAAQGRGNRVLTGTFTIGGASAQIAIPLMKPQDVADFNDLQNAISRELDCTKLTLADGSTAPVFNRKREGGATKECIDDYITYMPKDAIVVTENIEMQSIRVDDIQGLGLISFLGLRGSGSFVAGGLNEIQNWAETQGCGHQATDFEACVVKLQVALSKDLMWKHVTSYFQKKAVNIDSFSYNTPAAIPEMSGLPTGDGSDQAWKLEEEVNKTCRANPSAHFGYKNSNTCMKALFTSMYVTSFFLNKTDTGKEHVAGELFHDSKRGWTEGKRREIALVEADRVGIRFLLNTPLQRHGHASSYLEGAMLHFKAVGRSQRKPRNNGRELFRGVHGQKLRGLSMP